MAEINALYREQIAQLRAIYDLKGKQAAGKQDSEALVKEIAQREKLRAAIQEEIRVKAQGVDTSAQERNVQTLEQELGRRVSLKQALYEEKAAQDEANRSKQQYQSIGEQIAKTTTSLLTVYAAKKLREFWKEAIDYAKLYYDQLNEIRIVTTMSEADAERLG